MRYLITILTLLSCLTAKSQGLSFAMAKEGMLENNLEIQAARQTLDIAKMELKATRGLRYPNIDFVGGYTLMQRDVKIDLNSVKNTLANTTQNFINEGISSGLLMPNIAELVGSGISPLLTADWGYTLQKRSTLLGAITATQPIYMGGSINAAITAADIAKQSAEYQLKVITNKLTTQLVEYYYGVILAEKAVELSKRVVKGIENHLFDAEAMEEEGIIAHSEVLYIKYRLSEAERESYYVTNKLKLAREALSQILNRECNEILTDRIFIVDSIYSIDYYTESAININPIILIARGNIALSEQGIKLARAALLPEVAAMGGAIVASHNLSDLVPRWSVGIGVRLKLFDGLGKERRLIAAQRTNNTSFTVAESLTNSIALLTEQEYYNAINSLRDVAKLQSSIEFASAYLEAKQEGFNEGITPASELIDAELELRASELKQLSAAFDFCKYLARLLEAAGMSESLDEYIKQAIFL